MSATGLRLFEYCMSGASKFGSLNLGKPYCAFAALQAGAVYLQGTNSQAAKDTHKITTILLAVNAAGLIWSAGKLIHALQDRYELSLISPRVLSPNWTLPGWSYKKIFAVNILGLGALGFGAYGILRISGEARNYLKPDLREVRHGVTIESDTPMLHKISQALYVSQIIFNLALFVFGKDHIQTVITLGGLGATFYSSATAEWIKLSIRSEGYANTITYQALLLPDPEDNNKRIFCSSEHAFEKRDLLEHLATKVAAIKAYADQNHHYRIHHHHDQHGRHMYTSYTLDLPVDMLPACPSTDDCGEQPSHTFLKTSGASINYEGVQQGSKSDFGATVYFAYGVVQLGLAFLQQKYPHLAGSIYKAQMAMMALDVVAIAAKAYDYSEMHNAEWGFEAICTVIALSIFVAGYLIYLHQTSSGPNLADQLEGMIPETDLATLTIDKTSPWSFRFMQWMLANKILFDLALPLSGEQENSNLHFISAAVECMALYKLSKLDWLSFKRTMPMPLMDRPFKMFNHPFLEEVSEASRESFRNVLLSATPQFQFIIPDKDLIFPNGDVFKEALKTIYDYSSDFFEDSHWKWYWHITRGRYGQELSRKLIFNVQVIPRPLKIGKFDFFDFLRSWSGSAHKRWDGVGTLKIAMQ